MIKKQTIKDKRVDIVLVEDNEYEAKLAIYNLKMHYLGDHLIHLKDGAQAVDYIFGKGSYATRGIKNKPKVILLDINLPKYTGLEILEMVKKDKRTQNIPVVILTSSRDSKDVAKGKSLGANGYIVKPLEYEAFSDKMRELGIYWDLANEAASYEPTSLLSTL